MLGNDYVEVARLRGLSDRRIATWYVARNAILPLYTGFLLLLGFRLGGTIILEQIFSYPGLGYYMWSALESNDYPLMMATFILTTAVVIVGRVLTAEGFPDSYLYSAARERSTH